MSLKEYTWRTLIDSDNDDNNKKMVHVIIQTTQHLFSDHMVPKVVMRTSGNKSQLTYKAIWAMPMQTFWE